MSDRYRPRLRLARACVYVCIIYIKYIMYIVNAHHIDSPGISFVYTQKRGKKRKTIMSTNLHTHGVLTATGTTTGEGDRI